MLYEVITRFPVVVEDLPEDVLLPPRGEAPPEAQQSPLLLGHLRFPFSLAGDEPSYNFV